MAKVLRCGDLMPDCSCTAVMEGKDVAEVMVKAEEHAWTAHGMTTIPPEVTAKVRTAIKNKYDANSSAKGPRGASGLVYERSVGYSYAHASYHARLLERARMNP